MQQFVQKQVKLLVMLHMEVEGMFILIDKKKNKITWLFNSNAF